MHGNDDRAATVLDKTHARSSVAERMSIAVFVGFDEDGRYQVELAGGGGPLVALATVPLTVHDKGSQVLVTYVDDDGLTPIVIGRLRERATPLAPGVMVDGERLVIRGEREVELRCGEASIVLTRAGKVLIRGEYVLSRSRGGNKIKGAYVEIN